MDFIDTLLQHLSSLSASGATWVHAHLSSISTAIVMTLLVIFGDDINKFVKGHIRQYSFLVRTTAFVALCAVGYGVLSVAAVPAVASLLRYFGDRYLPLTVIAAFIALGMLAERKNYL
jgi:hypothetical protein